MEIIDQIMESWQNASERHAMLVHWPVVLAVLGVPLVIAGLVRPKSHVLRWLLVLMYAAIAVAAYFASESGHEAETLINPAMAEAGGGALDEHESLGERAWWFAGATAVVLMLTMIDRKRVRVTAYVIALALAVVTTGWITLVAHHGGTLVYRYDAVKPKAAPPSTDDGGPSVDPLAAADPRLVHFTANVVPIFEEYCWGCHNTTRPKGGLNMMTMAAILAGGSSAPDVMALVPGAPEDSLIVQAVRYDDPFLAMPPDDAGGKLSDEEIAAIEKWVTDGAVWSAADVPAQAPDEAESGSTGD